MTREEARLTLQDNFGYLSQEHPRILEALRVALDALPILPSNLDEAARKYADESCFDDPEFTATMLAFKAGAEWMAGQGASFNTKVGWIDGPTILDWPDDILDKFEMGDEVIVQIRKKQ